jgi:serine O-acetyltransferase
MFKLIASYKKMDPAARNSLEVLLLYPGVKAIFFHRIAHALFLWKIPFIPRMISEISRWLTGIEIHPGATIGSECVFDHGMGTVIGETAVVGARVLIYHGVTLGGTKHTRDKRHPTIEDDVILGAGCQILGNITVGTNARIGANSVVLHDVPAHMTAAGIPAKIVTKSSPEFQDWELEFYI